MKKAPTGGFARLVQMMAPHWGKLLICFFCVLAVNAAEIIKPLAAAEIMDGFLSGAKQQHGLWSLEGISAGYLLLVLASAAFSIIQARLISRVSQHILHDLREKVFSRITRMSALRFSDLILFLDDGRVAEAGTHAQLMEQRGLYYDAWMRQAREAEGCK